jgi:elongation factor P
MIQTTQIKKGMTIKMSNDPWKVLAVQHIAPGNWRAMVVCKLRNLLTGNSTEVRFRSDERVEEADLDHATMEYLYQDGDDFHFMDTKTFDQITMRAEDLGDNALYLTANIHVEVQFFEQRPIGIELPKTVDLTVIETEPAMRDATAAAQMKPAVLETGLKIGVPPFVQKGDKVTIDTVTGEYLERA